jgi:Mg2+-importing ATPase
MLLFIFRAQADSFRTGWFLESVISASVIVLVIRTRRPFYESRPGKYMLTAPLLIAGLALLLPFSPLGGLFKFRPLLAPCFFALGAIVVLYIIAAEMAKKLFYKNIKS